MNLWDELDYEHDAIIEASAGTGKTYTLQHIVVKLLASGRVHSAKEILLVTYTDKATGELRDRIREILTQEGIMPPDFDEMIVSTIHSFCQKILTEYAFENGLPIKRELADNDADLALSAAHAVLYSKDFRDRNPELETTLSALKMNLDNEFITRIQTYLLLSKNGQPANALEEEIQNLTQLIQNGKRKQPAKERERDKLVFIRDFLSMAWPIFQKRKQEQGTLSFDDMVREASTIISNEAQKPFSPLLNLLRNKYKVALVDEFQDTDSLQWSLFHSLFSSENGTGNLLLVVGDPKQAIYSFRGADIGTYLAAKAQITGNAANSPACKSLTATYRSTRTMIENTFNKMFSAPGWFSDMTINGMSIQYQPVVYPKNGNPKFDNFEQEDYSGRASLTLLESLPFHIQEGTQGGFGNKDQCLPLFAKNAAAEIKRLMSLKNAWPIRGKNGTLQRTRLSYGDFCFLVRGKSDAFALKKALTAQGIPFAHYKEAGLYDSAESEAVLTILAFLANRAKPGALQAVLLSPFFAVHPKDLEKTICTLGKDFNDQVDEWLGLVCQKCWSELFESLMNSTAIAKPAQDDFEFDRRWTALRQIFDQLLIQTAPAATSLDDFINALSTWKDNDATAGENGSIRQKETDSERVQIMTMHASKGLEFPVVFIACGFSAPKTNQGEDPIAVNQEQKRLFYVAITRAMYKVYLPWSQRACQENTADSPLPMNFGIGSSKSPLRGGFLAQGICNCFNGHLPPETAVISPSSPPEIPETANLTYSSVISADGLQQQPKAPSLQPCLLNSRPSIPGNAYFHWDSYTSLKHHQLHRQTATSDDNRENDEENLPVEEQSRQNASLLPRTAYSGTLFHKIMEQLCNNNGTSDHPGFEIGNMPLEENLRPNSSLMALILDIMERNAFSNQVSENDSTATTLARMIWSALNTPLVFGKTTFRLADIPPKERRAEVNFVIQEALIFEKDISAGSASSKLFNGAIDLLIRPDGPGGQFYILDWKTNFLKEGYSPSEVAASMEESQYTLQYQLYTLAASKWLGEDKIGGIAYLYVRGGEHGAPCGIFTEAISEQSRANYLQAVLTAMKGGLD